MFKRLASVAAIVAALGLLGACTPGAGPEDQIGFFFQEHTDAALKIASCESNMDPGAVSPTNDHGLFQINAVHRAEFERRTGEAWSRVYDPYWNAMYARMLFDSQGWSPWSCKRVL